MQQKVPESDISYSHGQISHYGDKTKLKYRWGRKQNVQKCAEVFNTIATSRYNNTLCRIRKWVEEELKSEDPIKWKEFTPDWCDCVSWEGMCDKWKKEKWQKMKKTNKLNRGDKVFHRTGSANTYNTRSNMGRQPSVSSGIRHGAFFFSDDYYSEDDDDDVDYVPKGDADIAFSCSDFFNTWAELCRGGSPNLPDFRSNYFGNSKAVLQFASSAGPNVTFPVDAPVRERIFHFSADAVRLLKSKANRCQNSPKLSLIPGQEVEICGKQIYDLKTNTKGSDISSFQSLCALIWQAVTRARKWLPGDYMTTFRMAINCRHRVEPRVSPMYFGNAIQSTPTRAKVEEVTGKDLRWVAGLLHASVLAHGDAAIRHVITDWEAAPKCFPLGNPDGTVINMGSSNRFPMYEGNDFGWGRPLAVRSGKANKFDGKMSAFSGREGDGSVDIEMCLAPETMTALLLDEEFMGFVSI
ncbi:hypothetical protein LUZ63_017854 [Rhynchospora breviuscula]|uniref:Uncharacterized protein n=1 Tax=Rhynchospora breviuscula TaxID=2022672 RepID=A0A9Q0C3A3_9POAL|nr:hypothetical protein LUZ63_017854 [Rhynchospora breviuscula]